MLVEAGVGVINFGEEDADRGDCEDTLDFVTLLGNRRLPETDEDGGGIFVGFGPITAGFGPMGDGFAIITGLALLKKKSFGFGVEISDCLRVATVVLFTLVKFAWFIR